MATLYSPSVALADARYEMSIASKKPAVKYFDEFTYDVPTVTGPRAELAGDLTRRIRAYTSPWVNYYLKPSTKTLKYLQRAQPAYFSATITPTPACSRDYVCLAQMSVFSTPLIAGSVKEIQARAWSSRTGKVARIQDFVSPSDLPRFTAKVRDAIRRAECYYGFDIKLPARYESFPNWVPLEKGLGVWFPEYQFGCQVMSLRIAWP